MTLKRLWKENPDDYFIWQHGVINQTLTKRLESLPTFPQTNDDHNIDNNDNNKRDGCRIELAINSGRHSAGHLSNIPRKSRQGCRIELINMQFPMRNRHQKHAAESISINKRINCVIELCIETPKSQFNSSHNDNPSQKEIYLISRNEMKRSEQQTKKPEANTT